MTGTFYPIKTRRILDTRSGLGAPARAVPGGGTLHLQVAGVGGVPATGAGAVVLNLTETASSTSGFASIYPSGQPRPTASSINYVRRVHPGQPGHRAGRRGSRRWMFITAAGGCT